MALNTINENCTAGSYPGEEEKDPLYRLTCGVEEASAEEKAEILEAVGRLSDDDLLPVKEKNLKL